MIHHKQALYLVRFLLYSRHVHGWHGCKSMIFRSAALLLDRRIESKGLWVAARVTINDVNDMDAYWPWLTPKLNLGFKVWKLQWLISAPINLSPQSSHSKSHKRAKNFRKISFHGRFYFYLRNITNLLMSHERSATCWAMTEPWKSIKIFAFGHIIHSLWA